MSQQLTEAELKSLLFEVYSAGFEAGMSQDIDIVTAYNNWWETTKKGQNDGIHI
jgi:hypothetical protein